MFTQDDSENVASFLQCIEIRTQGFYLYSCKLPNYQHSGSALIIGTVKVNR